MKASTCAAVGALLGAALLQSAAWAAEPPAPVVSRQAIEEALQARPEAKTRGLRLQARPDSQTEARAISLQIAFALNSSALLPEAQAQLRELAQALGSNALAGQRYELAGHTDASGAAEANRRLSLARAGAVRDYLTAAGVAAEQLGIAGYGADRPLTGTDPYAAANRRVEVRVKETTP